jgi:hypothetical protein
MSTNVFTTHLKYVELVCHTYEFVVIVAICILIDKYANAIIQ